MDNFLHNHKATEKNVSLDEYHVIVDREDWEIAKAILTKNRIAIVAKTRREFVEYVAGQLPYINTEYFHKYMQQESPVRIGIYQYIGSLKEYRTTYRGYNFVDMIILSKPEVDGNIDIWSIEQERFRTYGAGTDILEVPHSKTTPYYAGIDIGERYHHREEPFPGEW